MNRCRGPFTDSNGIPHDVEVQAESLYAAVALAVAEFRAEKMIAEVSPMTEFDTAIHRAAMEHRIDSVRSHNGPRAHTTVRRES